MVPPFLGERNQNQPPKLGATVPPFPFVFALPIIAKIEMLGGDATKGGSLRAGPRMDGYG